MWCAAGHRKLVCVQARKGGCTLPETVTSQWLDRNRSTHEAHGEELKIAAKILQGRRGAGRQHACRILRNDSRPSLAGLSTGCLFIKQGVVGHEAAPSEIFNTADPASCDKYRCIWLVVNGYVATVSLGQLKDAGADTRISPMQFGFRVAPGCANTLFVARRLLSFFLRFRSSTALRYPTRFVLNLTCDIQRSQASGPRCRTIRGNQGRNIPALFNHIQYRASCFQSGWQKYYCICRRVAHAFKQWKRISASIGKSECEWNLYARRRPMKGTGEKSCLYIKEICASHMSIFRIHCKNW